MYLYPPSPPLNFAGFCLVEKSPHYEPLDNIVGYTDSHIQSGLQLTTSSSSTFKLVSSLSSLKPAANKDTSFQSMLPPGGTHTFGNVLIFAARRVNKM